jgi:hypothetical protein
MKNDTKKWLLELDETSFHTIKRQVLWLSIELRHIDSETVKLSELPTWKKEIEPIFNEEPRDRKKLIDKFDRICSHLSELEKERKKE